ncbi:hypothetical protein N780_06760 [Pontibacillus chungwhensis BH030062]|uniref:DUF4129 domain-containing protein n=1 Tax=Pontibacillus chungwhensis BH030062 TaxID=1385513 RepID=A0A0A2UPB6_9BACI|nr:DUF4129 domain-containing protein [Pontibacillus chungwhensis]KGP90142.1 hypothetical protein N780_06760 [Pontibacillus chungwhensis BH030062]
MDDRRTSVAKTYLWIGEAMVFYLLLGPIYFLFYPSEPLPFWSFLLVVVVSKLLLALGVKVTTSYIIIIFYVPLTALVTSYFSPFNLIISILLSCYLAWRFIVHERDPELNNEQALLMASLLFLILNVLFFNQTSVYFMAALQLVVLVFGYLLSHVLSVDGQANKTSVYSRTTTVMGLFVGVTIGVFLIYDLFRAGFTGGGALIAQVFGLIVRGILFLFSWTGLGDEWNEKVNEIEPAEMELEDSGVGEEQPDPGAAFDLSEWMYWGALFMILVIGIVVAIRLRNKKIEPTVDTFKEEHSVTYSNLPAERKPLRPSTFKRLFQSAPNDEARKLFFNFEAFASKTGNGRAPSETIEEWFKRLGVRDGNADLYQKVRYGDQSLTTRELETFKETIESLKNAIRKK